MKEPKTYSRQDVKDLRKALDEAIRAGKASRKQNPDLSAYSNHAIAWSNSAYLHMLRSLARSYHVAVSELRGRSRGQIERSPRTKPNERLIASIKTKMVEANPSARVETASDEDGENAPDLPEVE